MKIPEGYTKEEVVKVVGEIIEALAVQFQFGSFEIDDLKQEGWTFAIDALERYNPDFGYKLNNFIYGHVKRRLINFKRDNYYRAELPCHGCPFFDRYCKQSDNGCTGFIDKRECDKWRNWENRNNFKKNINNPMDIYDLGENSEPERGGNDITLDRNELIQYVRNKLDMNLMGDFIKLLEGNKLSKKRKNILLNEIKNILRDKNAEKE